MHIPVGSARVDITPPLTIPYLGYVPRQSYFTGAHDPLYVRAVVFGEGAERVLLLSLDAIGFSSHLLGKERDLVRELRARIQTRCGVASDRILISVTHAHSTPETLGITHLWDVPAAAPWLETLLGQLETAAWLACESASPCTLKVGKGTALGVAYNRRPFCAGLSLEEQITQGKLDIELQVLVCEDESGDARHVLINFACHPVIVQVQPLISADFPGVAARLVEQNLPGQPNCLFLQGAAGNLNPVGDDTRDFRDVTRLGTMVAGETLKVAAHLLGDKSAAMEDITLRVASERVTLPPRAMPPRSECDARLQEALQREQQAVGEEATFEAKNEVRLAREAIDLIARFSEPQEAEAQVLRLGDLAIVASPGELFVEWGLQIKRESPAPHTFVVELANGWVGYLFNPGGFAEGGYEAGYGPWTQVSEEGASLLTEASLRLVRQLWS